MFLFYKKKMKEKNCVICFSLGILLYSGSKDRYNIDGYKKNHNDNQCFVCHKSSENLIHFQLENHREKIPTKITCLAYYSNSQLRLFRCELCLKSRICQNIIHYNGPVLLWIIILALHKIALVTLSPLNRTENCAFIDCRNS